MTGMIRIEALSNGNSFTPDTIKLASIALASAISEINFSTVSDVTEEQLLGFIEFLDGMVKCHEVDMFNEMRENFGVHS